MDKRRCLHAAAMTRIANRTVRDFIDYITKLEENLKSKLDNQIFTGNTVINFVACLSPQIEAELHIFL